MRRTARPARRWLTAGLVAVLVHGLVFLGLSLTPAGGPPIEPPIVEISLAPPERPKEPPPPPSPTQRARTGPLQLHQPPSLTGPVQGSGFQAGTPAQGAPPGPATQPPQAAAPAIPKLKLDCLHLGPAARLGVYGSVDCDQQRYAKIKGQDEARSDVPANPAWDAQIARQMQVHQPLPRTQPQLGNCDNQNLGFGCTDEMLVPLAKRKF